MTVAEQVRCIQPRVEIADLIGSDRCDEEVCNAPFAADFTGYPDELPASVSNFCAGDRVVHADHWQGELDTPEAEDLAWLAANPTPEPEWEPSPEDWRDYHEHCLEQERLDTIRRMEEYEHELRTRYGD